MLDTIQRGFGLLVELMAAVLFFNIAGFPFIVLWLIVASTFFTIYLRGVGFRLFVHAIQVETGRFDRSEDAGEVSHLQASLSALAATVGVGSIAGVSVAVALGGPGAVFWIGIAGLLGMATKFAEVTLSMCYRQIDSDGKVNGGPFQYLKAGMRELGRPLLGKCLALVFAVFCLGGALGGGNMFQANQAVKILTETFEPLKDWGWVVALALATFVFSVQLGSIKRIAHVAKVLVPLKGLLYLACAGTVICVYIDRLPSAIALILSDAFQGRAAVGGLIGMLAVSFKRASFANEAGLGSAPIAHAAAKTKEPIREAIVALLEPFCIAVIGMVTGLMVTISGAYVGASAENGVMIASAAFAGVSPWFPKLLAISVLLFACSTTIGWSYYGEIAWCYLFSRRTIGAYYVVFSIATFLGGIMDFGVVLEFSDLLILGMALPNVVALYLMRRRIKSELDLYLLKYHL